MNILELLKKLFKRKEKLHSKKWLKKHIHYMYLNWLTKEQKEDLPLLQDLYIYIKINGCTDCDNLERTKIFNDWEKSYEERYVTFI